MLDDGNTAPEAAEEPNPQEAPPKEEAPVEEESAEQKIEKALAKAEEAEEEKKAESKEGKEEKKEESKPKKSADDRIGEITKRFRTEERKNLALEKKLKELEGQVKGVTDERTQEKQKELDTEIDNLWLEHKKASAELEGGKASEIFRKIHELEKKKAAQSITVPKEADIDKKIVEREADLAAERFKKRNTWFNKDSDDYSNRMRRYAIVAEIDLKESGFEGTYAELLLEVEKDVEKTFKVKKSTGLANVASVNPTKRMAANKETILTDEQKKVAYGAFCGLSKREAEKKYIEILKKHGGTK